MLHSTPATQPAPQGESAALRAEIRRMADMVSGVVRSTAIDGTTAALVIAAKETPAAPKEARKVAHQILTRAEVMQGEIERFLAIAATHSAA